MTTPDLINWLRDNSSGDYRPSAEAADRLAEYELLLVEARNALLTIYEGLDQERFDANEAYVASGVTIARINKVQNNFPEAWRISL